MTEIARKPTIGKPVDGKPANDGYRCDLGKVLAHKGPLPHPQRIAAQGAI